MPFGPHLLYEDHVLNCYEFLARGEIIGFRDKEGTDGRHAGLVMLVPRTSREIIGVIGQLSRSDVDRVLYLDPSEEGMLPMLGLCGLAIDFDTCGDYGDYITWARRMAGAAMSASAGHHVICDPPEKGHKEIWDMANLLTLVPGASIVDLPYVLESEPVRHAFIRACPLPERIRFAKYHDRLSEDPYSAPRIQALTDAARLAWGMHEDTGLAVALAALGMGTGLNRLLDAGKAVIVPMPEGYDEDGKPTDACGDWVCRACAWLTVVRGMTSFSTNVDMPGALGYDLSAMDRARDNARDSMISRELVADWLERRLATFESEDVDAIAEMLMEDGREWGPIE